MGAPQDCKFVLRVSPERGPPQPPQGGERAPERRPPAHRTGGAGAARRTQGPGQGWGGGRELDTFPRLPGRAGAPRRRLGEARAAASAQAQARGRGGSWGGFFRKVPEPSGKGGARAGRARVYIREERALRASCLCVVQLLRVGGAREVR